MAELPPEASADDLSWSLAWAATDEGMLSGVLTAHNVSGRPVRLGHKPYLDPLDCHGSSLGAGTAHTFEYRNPPYAIIDPGGTASTPVGWAGWDGGPPCGDVRITWEGGDAIVTVDGPPRPRSAGPATNLWSSWFTARP